MINFIIWIVVGAVIGWVASIIMRTNNRQGPIADIVVGIVGAFVGGYFLSPLFNVGTINQGDFSIPALLVSLGWRRHSAGNLQAFSQYRRVSSGCHHCSRRTHICQLLDTGLIRSVLLHGQSTSIPALTLYSRTLLPQVAERNTPRL